MLVFRWINLKKNTLRKKLLPFTRSMPFAYKSYVVCILLFQRIVWQIFHFIQNQNWNEIKASIVVKTILFGRIYLILFSSFFLLSIHHAITNGPRQVRTYFCVHARNLRQWLNNVDFYCANVFRRQQSHSDWIVAHLRLVQFPLWKAKKHTHTHKIFV